MMKLKRLLILNLCLLTMFSCSSKKNKDIAVFCVYDNNSVLLSLSNAVYDDQSYVAQLFGEYSFKENDNFQIVNVNKTNIVFNQVFGAVWKTSFFVDEKEYFLYGTRQQDGNVISNQDIDCGKRKIQAFSFEHYGEMTGLFNDDLDYLFYC